MESRHTQYLDAMPGSQLLQLAQGGWVLSDIAKHDPKAWPVAPKVFKKPFGLCAMRTALADKDLDIRLFTGRLYCGAHRRAGQRGQEERQGQESVRDHDSSPRRTLASIIREGSLRNRAVALRNGQARRSSESAIAAAALMNNAG